MPRAPVITTKFSSSGLVALVLSNATFASRGYLWGYDGQVHYCFLNPKKRRFEIWKKQLHAGPFIASGVIGLLGGVLGGVLGGPFVGVAAGILALGASSFIPLLLYKHYYKTATEQDAAVVTNGPQMRLPFNWSYTFLFALLTAALLLPPIGFAIIGFLAGTVTLPGIGSVGAPIPFTLVGALAGVNLFGFLLFIVGLASRPFGTVQTPVGLGEVVPFELFTYFFGRDTPAFITYQVGPDNPPAGLTWASGGLIPIIVNGTPGGRIAGPVGTSYKGLIAKQVELVVWGLIPLALTDQPTLAEAIATQTAAYGNDVPDGLIIVAGSEIMDECLHTRSASSWHYAGDGLRR